MFQSFTASTRPEQGPPRLADLRVRMAEQALAGFIVPRADAHQGEYVAPRDERLAWLTGFTGSAGMAAVLGPRAAIFADGRYRLQARAQADEVFEIVPWPDTSLADWLKDACDGGRIGIDPWLHTAGEIEALKKALNGTEVEIVETENLVDAIWADQPDRPRGAVRKHPKEFAGKGDETKRAEIAEALRDAGQKAAVLTLPDSICWLLNIRGSDIPRIPITQAFAILHEDGRMDLFSDPAKFDGLGPDPAITLHDWDAFPGALADLHGPVRVDKSTAPLAVSRLLEQAGTEIVWADDPCVLPKARKSDAEIAGARAAHLRDGAAMCAFLHWLESQTPGTFTEIDAARALERFRRETGKLKDISFDTISGAGPHGAVVHYRVTEDTNRTVQSGELLLIDSGGQYEDGTTDITRTIAMGEAGAEERAAFNRVLRGMIALSCLRFPKGLSGRDIDALARAPLWMAGQDYDHGTGHGVGSYLSVHEGPARISRASTVPLEPGMILSNEPGYYRADAFGIRIENLVVVQKAASLDGGDAQREMLEFETLTFVPIDRRLIDPRALSQAESAWIDAYHAACRDKLAPLVRGEVHDWLIRATQPL